YAPFFQAVAQDPVLSCVKMIAEPWDLGPNGYQVGGFPKPWRELNGRYRDDTRLFWCGSPWATADFAKRFCGSQDIFGPAGRSPLTSVNFLTSHDGFTLRDVLSYHDKHNEANGEENRDGDNQNHSWNCGVEGETKDAAILALRRKSPAPCWPPYSARSECLFSTRATNAGAPSAGTTTPTARTMTSAGLTGARTKKAAPCRSL
ncbi:MAG: hypothetical protein WCN98_01160, partial [Verrucomicrobiaceae bacterium]